jgi:DNA topoisomerase-1
MKIFKFIKGLFGFNDEQPVQAVVVEDVKTKVLEHKLNEFIFLEGNQNHEEVKKAYQEKKSNDKAEKVGVKIRTLKLKKETKVKMKNVSLGTSKNNYIDPRIIFSFIKKFDIPPEKLFTKVLIKRFEWASKVDKDFRF